MSPPFPSRNRASATAALAALALLSGLVVEAMPAQSPFYTGPHGPGGTWNLYQVVSVPATFISARTAAKTRTAASTGLPGVTSTLTGHLMQIGSQDENTFVAAAATLGPGSGNSNIWLGLNDLDAPDGPGEKGLSRIGWQWADAGDQISAGEFNAWTIGEPNNAGGVEDGVEMRTDGSWNDANVSSTRKYVIEWELHAAAPIAGAAQYPVYYTGPYGAGGTWNLYRMVMQGETWDTARAAALAASAKSTGIAGVRTAEYGTLTGHLISLNTEAEHHFAWQAMAFGGLNTAGFWTGGTDRTAEGGDSMGTDPLAGWQWADEAPGRRNPFWHRFPRRPFFATPEPNNSGGAEDVIEVTGTGLWNDTASASATSLRRYVVEWDTELPSPVAGAARLAPMLTGTRAFAGEAGTGLWNVKGTVFPTPPSSILINLMAALQMVNAPPPPASTVEVATPVLNNTDGGGSAGTAGRSTNGLFWPRQPLANDTLGVDDNYYLVNGRTWIHCEAGRAYTINVHSDDGFYLRLTGVTEGTKAVFSKIGGLGSIDASDASAIFFVFGTSDSSTRGVFTVSATGLYQVEYVGYDITGGSFQEVSWAPAEALNDWDTEEWGLMGGTPSGSPQLPALGLLKGPPGVNRKWGTRAAVSPVPLTGIPDAALAIQSATDAVEGQIPVINYNDPQNTGSRFHFSGDLDIPGNTGADDNQLAVVAKTNFQVSSAGPWTFCVRADDNFALRVAGRKWSGRTASYTAVAPFYTSNGFIDPLDPSTLFWLASGDTNARAVINFPTTGSYSLEFLHYEGTGGAGAEVYCAPGICTSDSDSTAWQLIGDTSGYTPFLPLFLPGATEGEEGRWGLQVLEPAAIQVTNMASAIAALMEGAGTNHQDTPPVLNHIVPSSPGSGGFFGGDLVLPGIDAANNANLAIHARGRVVIPSDGFYTFAVRSADGWALRFRGVPWLDRSGAGIDPADTSTLIFNVTGSATALGDFRGAGLIYLTQGSHEVDFVTFQDQRDTQFELYAVAGNLLGTADTAALGTVNTGDAGPGAAWRLVGHRSQGIFPRLGVTASWSVRQTRPQAGAYPGAGTVEAAVWWLAQPDSVNGLITVSAGALNFNDPGFGGTGSFANDAPIPWNNSGTPADDNYFATLMEGTIRVPADGEYFIGWQGDDGGFLEFVNPPWPVSFNHLTANATGNSVITDSSDGLSKGRLQHNGGGGNTRTIGAIELPAGQYPVRVMWFEDAGSSHFEVFAAGPEQPYNLITTTSGTTANGPQDSDGLQLEATTPAGPPLEIISVSFPASRELSLVWASAPGKNYTVQRSTNLTTWSNAELSLPSGGSTTTYTSPPLPVSAPRYFYRVRER
ncbi:MAG: autotransporter-associated beta strand repeat protein [Verrucomicrobiales bacterium]|nr:autotransporter-associated beta strand repeat protein [Verrucomicrobiales bacterium]